MDPAVLGSDCELAIEQHGRIRPPEALGHASTQANREMQVIAKRLESEFPDLDRGWSASVTLARGLRNRQTPSHHRGLAHRRWNGAAHRLRERCESAASRAGSPLQGSRHSRRVGRQPRSIAAPVAHRNHAACIRRKSGRSSAGIRRIASAHRAQSRGTAWPGQRRIEWPGARFHPGGHRAHRRALRASSFAPAPGWRSEPGRSRIGPQLHQHPARPRFAQPAGHFRDRAFLDTAGRSRHDGAQPALAPKRKSRICFRSSAHLPRLLPAFGFSQCSFHGRLFSILARSDLSASRRPFRGCKYQSSDRRFHTGRAVLSSAGRATLAFRPSDRRLQSH